MSENRNTFRDRCEPLRPELYRYCRHLTRSAWDAEDMAQDTLARAFVTLGGTDPAPQNMRAWLFRVASNLWLNRIRQAREVLVEHDEPTSMKDPRATREAAGTLFSQLAPQERAAVVLKDAFGLSLEEIAETLSTSTGAVKAALHRGRGKLAEPAPERTAEVAPAVLNAFCEEFNKRDLERLTALLLEGATLEYPGFKTESGAAAIRESSFKGTLYGCPELGFTITATPRCELRTHRGESLLLWWSGDEVHAVVRVEVDGERISRLINYYHSPEVVAEVCQELALPWRTHGYHPEAWRPTS